MRRATTKRAWGASLAASLALGACLVLACNSAYSTAGSDGSGDASNATTDGAIEDAKSDASAPDATPPQSLCDVEKPFDPPIQVSSLEGNPGASSVRLSSDYLTGYFAASGPDGGVGMLYSATRASPTGPFGAAAIISGLYSAGSTGDAHPSISGDGLSLFFDTNLALTAGGSGTQDIFRSVRAHPGDAWGTPSTLAMLDTAQFESEPFIREDGHELYLTYSMNGAPTAVYRSLSSDGQTFQTPTEVTELASGAGDGNAAVTPDDLVIYFYSDRSSNGARGGEDIWVASRASTSDPFSSLTNVAELNTPNSDRPDFITRDRCTLYFHETITGSDGNPTKTIYVATKTP